MRASKVKKMRRALREELKTGKERWVAHPTTYENVRGETMLKFQIQYIQDGGKRLMKVAKKIYQLYGMLPR